MKSSRINKLLISGYYGFNNIGDESILRAVVDNLKEKLEEIEITVLSQDPTSTQEKYGVGAVDRKSVFAVIRAIKQCDILISGGGSLLQDVTSKRSIFYYLFIMWVAHIFGKKVVIYSQGIGPINSSMNRKITGMTLKKADGIVVRDDSSKELLVEIGIPSDRVIVTADPVLRIKPASLETGKRILELEGFVKNPDKITVGFAIRERKLDSNFMDQLCISISRLMEEHQVQIVLIPFHYSEDMGVIDEIERRLGKNISVVRHKYLTDEMLSIIGNMDFLVGVRLHALIHAAIMQVPMIGISYDPKINSFLNSIGLRAMCSIYDFDHEYFMEEFEKTWQNKVAIQAKVRGRMENLIKKLDENEEIIKELMEK